MGVQRLRYRYDQASEGAHDFIGGAEIPDSNVIGKQTQNKYSTGGIQADGRG